MPHQRKILTVVLLSAGCGASSSRALAPTTTATRVPTPDLAAASNPSAAEPVAALELVSTPPAPPRAPAPTTPPAVKPDREQPEEILHLRSELYRADRGELAAHHARFRALCDEHGYPVVGNVASKSMRHDVSGFCEDVRTQLVMRATSPGDA